MRKEIVNKVRAINFKKDISSEKTILNFIPIKIFIIDKNYCLLFFNQKFLKEKKLFTKKKLNKGVSILPSDKSKKEWKDYFEMVFLGGSLTIEKNYLIGKNEFFELITLSPFRDDNGEIIGCIYFAENILSQKKLEESLKNEKNQNKVLNEKIEKINRALSTNLMFITSQNEFLNSIQNSIQEISKHVNSEAKKELNKLNTKIKSRKFFEETWNNIKIHFERIHPDFFNLLKKENPKLTDKELRHCAYIKMGLSIKETAQLMNVVPKTIEMARYRIKKKLNLSSNKKLSDVIRQI